MFRNNYNRHLSACKTLIEIKKGENVKFSYDAKFNLDYNRKITCYYCKRNYNAKYYKRRHVKPC